MAVLRVVWSGGIIAFCRRRFSFRRLLRPAAILPALCTPSHFRVACPPFHNPADDAGAYRAADAARLQYGRKGRLNVQTASTEQAI